MVDFKNSNITLLGGGVDTNGNHVVKFKYPNSRGYSIQTNQNLPSTQRLLKGDKNMVGLSDADLATIEKEIVGYIKAYGSAKVKDGLRVYGSLKEASFSDEVELDASPYKGYKLYNSRQGNYVAYGKAKDTGVAKFVASNVKDLKSQIDSQINKLKESEGFEEGDTVVAIDDIENGFTNGGRTPRVVLRAGEEATIEYIDGDNIGLEDIPGEYDISYFRATGMNESWDIFDKRQVGILKDIIKNPNKALLGDISVEDAIATLKKKFKYTDAQINKLKEADDKFLAPDAESTPEELANAPELLLDYDKEDGDRSSIKKELQDAKKYVDQYRTKLKEDEDGTAIINVAGEELAVSPDYENLDVQIATALEPIDDACYDYSIKLLPGGNMSVTIELYGATDKLNTKAPEIVKLLGTIFPSVKQVANESTIVSGLKFECSK